ncbi:hypothetical protein PV04_10294 [Phialophora macrospora]|uniref:Uncharacterized protein n=1 Tax=Phialophora macrospora TaxID=1851006 RepID=A0A0D2F6B3_9EURO|nr:hypothetical protein PV04_10294 [Phialophora macrospora]
MGKSTSGQQAMEGISQLLESALVQARSLNPVRHEPPNEVDRLARIACTSFADSSLTRAYLRMMEEERADTVKMLEQPTMSPKRNAAAGSIQLSSLQTFSLKPFKFSGMTSSDPGSHPLCGLHLLADDGEFEMEAPELRDEQNELVAGTSEVMIRPIAVSEMLTFGVPKN